MKSRFLAIVLVFGGVALTVPHADAQATPPDKRVRFGIQGSFAEYADLGLGARAIFDLSGHKAGLTGIAAFDYFFGGAGGFGNFLGVDVNYWEANGNVVYTFSRTGSVQLYVGAGLNLGHSSASSAFGGGSSSRLGLNALGGITFGKRGRTFAEGRLELGGGSQFVASAGVRF